MNTKRIVLGVVILIFGAVYLLNRKQVEFISQDGFRVEAIGTEGVELKSVIHLHNPNLLSSTIKKVHEKFIINGVVVGELDNQLDQGIPGMKDTEFPVSIRFSRQEYESAMRGMAGNNTIQVQGEIVFDSFTNSGETKVDQATEWKP